MSNDSDIVHITLTPGSSNSTRTGRRIDETIDRTIDRRVDMPVLRETEFVQVLQPQHTPLHCTASLSRNQPDSVSSSQQFTVEEQITTVRIPMRRPNWQFLEILHEGGATGEVFTMKEIVHHVKNYIIKHQLFDPSDPRIVHCSRDKLGNVFQVQKFTINEAVPLFTKHSLPVPDSCIRIRRQLVKKAVETVLCNASFSSSSVVQGESSSMPTVSSTEDNPAGCGSSHSSYASIASSSSTPSLTSFTQEAEGGTESKSGGTPYGVNIQYGDELDGTVPVVQVNLDTDNQSLQMQVSEVPEEDSVSVLYDSDYFAVEYELEPNDHPSESEHSSNSKQDYLLVRKESDVEFFADYSDSENGSDLELQDGDQWECDMCHTRNIPYYRNCSKCWSLRPHWLPEPSDQPTSSVSSSAVPLPAEPCGSQHGYYAATSGSNDEQGVDNSQGSLTTWRVGDRVRPRRIRVMSVSSSDRNSESLASEDEAPITSGSQELSASQSSLGSQLASQGGQEDAVTGSDCRQIGGGKWNGTRGKGRTNASLSKDLCLVCASRPKTGSIIHGSSGHQVCCYRCAKRLRRKNKPCPVCRKPIQKVIKNFVL